MFGFLFVVVDDNEQRTLSQSEAVRKFAQANLAKVNAMRSSIFHQLPILRVANLITYFTLRETIFRGPLSSTICATFLLSQSNRGAQVFASNSLRSNYSSRCSHYSQNKFGILLSKNLAKEKCFAFFVYLLSYHLLQVVD